MAKVMVSLPEDLLAEIDRVVSASATTRSGFLQAAARDRLERTRRPFDRAAALHTLRATAGPVTDAEARGWVRTDRDDPAR